MTTVLQQSSHTQGAARGIPDLRLPPANLFGLRAQRLEQLAEHHPLGNYLRFAARLALAQQDMLDAGPEAELPARERLMQCRKYGMPPLAPAGLARPPGWRATARQLARTLHPTLPASGQAALQPVLQGPDDWMDRQAGRLLDGNTLYPSAAVAPVIGAALQVHWTHLARQLDPALVARPELPRLCPVCGAHPVSSVVRIGGANKGRRYLHCTLCSSEWHVARSRCSNCDNTRNIAYHPLEGGDQVVLAESCPECQTYLNVVCQDRNPMADPVADDLATLMGEAGYARSGINWYLIQGHP
jgi:FdhE protein